MVDAIAVGLLPNFLCSLPLARLERYGMTI